MPRPAPCTGGVPCTGGAPDAVLVARARAGDKDAFGVLVTRHTGTARALAARLLGDGDLARDVVHEAVVVALLSLPRLTRPGSFGPWLCGIALNVARQLLRERRPAAGPPSGYEPADTAPGPDERAVAADLGRRVRAAVAGLPPGQRAAVWLFYLQGLSHREVAAELDISVGAVKARLHQARANLRPQLSALAGEEPDMTDTTRPGPRTGAPRWRDVTIAGIRRAGGDARIDVVVLRETEGGRELPIGVLAFAGTSLAVILESVEMARPMTHQLTADLLAAAGAGITEVRITELAAGTFYAAILLDTPGGPREVDARPSDALSLAALHGAPVRVDEQILDDPAAVGSGDWREYPQSEVEIAATVRRGQED